MKIDFPFPQDEKVHKYCIECHADNVQEVERDGITLFACPSCGKISERYIHISNAPDSGKWWLDDQDEVWHETAGVFVRNPEGKYLFFERTQFPLGYTIPAGHVDNNEDEATAAVRELYEEVGIESNNMHHIFDTDIDGDSCVGGADTHRWHAYREDLPGAIEVSVKEEGRRPVWLTLEEALDRKLPLAMRYMIENYAEAIESKTA